MNKKNNKNEKLDLNKVSGGDAHHWVIKNPDGTFVNDIYSFQLRVDKDGFINSEDVAQLTEAGYYLRNNQLVIEPTGLHKTLNTKAEDKIMSYYT